MDGEELARLEAEVTQLEIESSPASFAQAITRQYSEPWVPYRWLKYVDRRLMELVEGKGKNRLLLTAPPRHGKSQLCSIYLPAWYLNRYPNKRVMLCAYGDDFAMEWGRKVRDLIENNPSLLSISVSKSNSAADRWDLAGNIGGGMKTAGAGGQIVGRGAHLLIIDDPIKDQEEAHSLAIREKKWDWWRTTVQSRLEPGAVVVLMHQRWHEDDLAGRILEHEGDRWDVVNFPAIAEEDDPIGRMPGEALCPERYNENALANIKESMGPAGFSALYQQRPTPEGGGRFRKELFREWSDRADDPPSYLLEEANGERILVPKEDCGRFVTMDTASTEKTSGDYTVACVWDIASHLKPSRLILVDVIRERTDDPLGVAERVNKKYAPSWIGIENAAIAQTMISEGLRRGLPIRRLKYGRRDKWLRSGPAVAMLEAGRVYFPRRAVWRAEWDRELLGFPAGTHDDQVDCFSYAADEFARGFGSIAPKATPEVGKSLDDRVWAHIRSKSRAEDHPTLGIGY